jgi:hypothetical protein
MVLSGMDEAYIYIDENTKQTPLQNHLSAAVLNSSNDNPNNFIFQLSINYPRE